MKRIKDISVEELTQLFHDAASVVASQPADAALDKMREGIRANRSLVRQALKRRGATGALLRHFESKGVACSADSLRAALAAEGLLQPRRVKSQP